MSEQNVYTAAQMEILRHVEKHGVLPHGVNHDDVAKLTKGYLIRLAGVSDARVMLYRLNMSGRELLKELPAPTDELARLRHAIETALYMLADGNGNGAYEHLRKLVDADERARKALEGGE